MYLEDLVPGINIEDKRIEFKRYLEEGKSADSGKAKEVGWLKTIAAFANTQGGTIFVGVDNATHKIISLDHESADKLVLMVNRQIKQRIEPFISYDIEAIPVKEEGATRYLLRIRVDRSPVLPVILHEDNLLGIYVRSFGSSVLASPEQIRDLVLMSENTPFDQRFMQEAYVSDEYSLLKGLYSERTGNSLSEKALISAGAISLDHKVSYGLSLFKDDYCGERTKIVCTLWPDIGKGSSVILASEEISGNVLESIRKSIAFVLNHSVNGFRKESDSRVDYYSYPARSVTEGVVNAVAHRNYFMAGSQIEINMFKDRLEITSPGSLLGVNALNKEKNISSIIPRRRNEVICSLLEYCRYMESKGSGFDKIEQDYAGKGDCFRPYISSDGSSFTLTLPNLTYALGVIDENSIPEIMVNGILEGKNSEKILSYCYMKAHTALEIAEYVGVKPSTYFRKEILGSLMEKGYLVEDSTQKPALYLSNPSKVMVK